MENRNGKLLEGEENVKNTTVRNQLSKGGSLDGIRCVFPTGSLKPTTVFGGLETHAWFDVHDFSDRTVGEEDQIIGMKESISYLKGLINDEIELLQKDRSGGHVIIGGFSQGSAMAVIGMLSGEFEDGVLGVSVGGLVGFSGWLPFRGQVDDVMKFDQEKDPDVEKQVTKKEKGGEWWRGWFGWIWEYIERCRARISWLPRYVPRKYRIITEHENGNEEERKRRRVQEYIRNLLSLPPRSLGINPKMPILLGHGAVDQKVEYEWALQMRHSLMEMGLNMKGRRYEGVGHWYCQEEMRDFVGFLREIWGMG